MANITWTVSADNAAHVIRLVHGFFGGQREIWLDDQLVQQGRMLFDKGSRHFITVDGIEFEVDIVTNGISFAYFLVRDGYPIPSDSDRAKGITTQDLMRSRYLCDLPFWHDLRKALNFSMLHDRYAAWIWRYRLVGSVQGLIVVVQKGIFPRINREGWLVTIRHAQPFSPDAGKQIWSDSRIAPLLGNLKKLKGVFEHNPDSTWMFLPSINNETPAELAARIQTLISVVARYVPPIPDGTCEHKECKQRLVTERQLVMINRIPWLFCEECVKEIPEMGKQAEKAYKAAPHNLLPGLMIGIGIALLGSLIWAAFAMLFDRIAAAISYGMLIFIVRGMDKAGTKRSTQSLLLAFLLTMFSTTLGYIASLLVAFLREGFPLSLQTLGYMIDATLQDPSMLVTSYIFTVLGAGFAFWSGWSQHRRFLSQSFKPNVELLPKEILLR